jgi:hypothetical protein
MLPSSQLSARGCVTKRCWRSWPRAMWTTSPHSSPWLINVPGPLRVVLGTRRHKLGSPKWAVQMLTPRAMAKRKRGTRVVAARSNRILLQSSLTRLGARVSATSTHDPKKEMAAHAQCTPTAITVPQTAGRLSNSQVASASGASSPPRTARRLVTGYTRKRPMKGLRLWGTGPQLPIAREKP